MKTDVTLRGTLARRSRLASACEARLLKTFQRHAERIAQIELRLESTGAHDPSCRATLIVQPVRGHALLITAQAEQPWTAAAQASQQARKQLEVSRKRNRARTRRAQRVWSEQRWAA